MESGEADTPSDRLIRSRYNQQKRQNRFHRPTPFEISTQSAMRSAPSHSFTSIETRASALSLGSVFAADDRWAPSSQQQGRRILKADARRKQWHNSVIIEIKYNPVPNINRGNLPNGLGNNIFIRRNPDDGHVNVHCSALRYTKNLAHQRTAFNGQMRGIC